VAPQASPVRIVRFKELDPQAGYDPNVFVWQPATSGSVPSVFVLSGPPAPGTPAQDRHALVGDPDTKLLVVECPPGDTPVLLPVFVEAKETFMCLKCRIRGRWGDQGEHETILEPFDTMAVPPHVCRDFVNVTEETAYLLVMLNGLTKPRPAERQSTGQWRAFARRHAEAAGRLMSAASIPLAGLASGLALLAVLLLWSPLQLPGSKNAVTPAPSEEAPSSSVPTSVPTSRSEAPPRRTTSATSAALARFSLIAPPSGAPLVAPLPNLPLIAGREGVARIDNLSISVQRTPVGEEGGRVVDYRVRIATRDGRPVTGADVRLRGQTADGSTVETRIEPAAASGVYHSAVIMPPGGLRQLMLRIADPESPWDLLQRILGQPSPTAVHIVRLGA